MRASIIIATHGDEKWARLARERAYPSALIQGDYEIILHHDPGTEIHKARNSGASRATGEWLCFLDADDELESGYVDAMLNGSGDLRYPRVKYVSPGQNPAVITAQELKKRHLLTGNYMVIGTMLKKKLFEKVGGFDKWESWEDWACYIKCWLAGAESQLIPEAVYRIYHNPLGRCTAGFDGQKLFMDVVAYYRPQAEALGLV